jgi:toxoflavin synthase
MSSQPYDLIAKAYSKTDSSLTKEHVAKPTLANLLGNTRGKRVIDPGCGSGYSTRLVRNTGSNDVIGVDISAEQIRIAQEFEQRDPLGITYYQHDIGEPLQFQDFDVATALYLLHYASSKDELQRFCENIGDALRAGGRFVTINSNPDHPTLENPKYGITATINPPVVGGSPRIVTYLDEKEQLCSFTTYFWGKDTYEEALTNAGFENIEWHNPIVSEEGMRRFGKQFWDEFLDKPFICGLTCTKT